MREEFGRGDSSCREIWEMTGERLAWPLQISQPICTLMMRRICKFLSRYQCHCHLCNEREINREIVKMYMWMEWMESSFPAMSLLMDR